MSADVRSPGGPAPCEAATLEAMRECFRMVERFAAWGRNLPDAADLAKAREELKRIGYAGRAAVGEPAWIYVLKPTDDEEGPTSLCHAGKDGECNWSECPQLRDNEPATSHRHCPLDRIALLGERCRYCLHDKTLHGSLGTKCICGCINYSPREDTTPMKATDMVATVRLVDFSSIIHAVTERGFDHQLGGYDWREVTFCGRVVENHVLGDGHGSDVTCRSCRRAMRITP